MELDGVSRIYVSEKTGLYALCVCVRACVRVLQDLVCLHSTLAVCFPSPILIESKPTIYIYY